MDRLLTDFLGELGVSVEEFFKIAGESKDKLTTFVVQTILTVDDFLMFKAMMVKRNIDLTNQARAFACRPRRASAGHVACGVARSNQGLLIVAPPQVLGAVDELKAAMDLTQDHTSPVYPTGAAERTSASSAPPAKDKGAAGAPAKAAPAKPEEAKEVEEVSEQHARRPWCCTPSLGRDAVAERQCQNCGGVVAPLVRRRRVCRLWRRRPRRARRRLSSSCARCSSRCSFLSIATCTAMCTTGTAHGEQ